MEHPGHIRYIRRTVAFLTVLTVAWSAALAQNRVSGKVSEKVSGEPVAGVNVMVRQASGIILGYASTDKDGCYSIEYASSGDTLSVSVTGFNIGTQSRPIHGGGSNVDFVVEYARQKIRESKVSASPISRHKDTVTYYVENFRDSTDRSIGEVLKKLPGIQVTQSGGIKYQGKEINRFYIEGMDMLGGRYGVATNNIQAKDVAAVEVYENHQPVKVLQDWVKSDRAAINLKLKSGAKGTWNVILSGGAGYRPLLWSGEAVPMYFGKGFQTISTYKTNNTGDDVSRELVSHYDGLDTGFSLLHVTEPQDPPVSEHRYLDNGIHAVSVNTISRLGEDTDLTADLSYVHDDQRSEGSSATTYHLPEGDPMTINENTGYGHRTDRIGLNLQFRTNNRKTYITERLSFDGERISDGTRLHEDGNDITQDLGFPRVTVVNCFMMTKRVNSWRLNLDSKTDWETRSSTLSVSPTPYPGIFGVESGTADAVQTLSCSRIRTRNSFYMSRMAGRWGFFINGGLNFRREAMNSSLYAITDGGAGLPAADSMRNDIVWHRLDVKAGPSVTYTAGGLSINLTVPLDLMNTVNIDGITGSSIGKTALLFSPGLSVMTRLSDGLKMDAYVSWDESAGDLYDSYGGYVMTGYRTVGKKDGIPQRTSRQTASLDFSYSDVLNAVFISASALWWRSRSNVTIGTDYSGTLSVSTSEETPNVSQRAGAEARISKRIGFLSSTISLEGGWSRSWYEYLRQGVLVPTSYDSATAGLSIDSQFGSRVVFGYDGDYTRSMGVMDNVTLDPIDMVSQSADISVILPKGVILKAGGEHYFNVSIEGRDRNMFFLDASISFRKGRFEYLLEGRNLLDSRTFSSAVYSDITSYTYTTALRPVSVMFKVRFSLR